VVLLVASLEDTSRKDEEFWKTALDDAGLNKIARTYVCKSKPRHIYCIVLQIDEQLTDDNRIW